MGVHYGVRPSSNSSMFVYNVKGTFITGPLIGVTSNATYTLNVASDFAPLDNPFEDVIDNSKLEEEGLNFIDWSEKNPFGES